MRPLRLATAAFIAAMDDHISIVNAGATTATSARILVEGDHLAVWLDLEDGSLMKVAAAPITGMVVLTLTPTAADAIRGECDRAYGGEDT